MKKGTLNFPYTGPKDEPFKGIGGRGNCGDAYPQKWLQGTPESEYSYLERLRAEAGSMLRPLVSIEPSKFKCCNIWY